MLKARLIYLPLLIGCAALYLFFNDYIGFMAIILMTLIPVLLCVINCIASVGVSVKFSGFSSAVQKGNNAKIKFTVTNKSIFNIPNAKLIITYKNEFERKEKRETILFPINAKSVTTLETGLISLFCGNVTVCIKKIKLYDMLTLTTFHKRINVKKSTIVLPNVYDIKSDISIPMAYDDESHEYSKTKSGDDGSQVFDFHEYHDGDKMKNVHWKLSTKLDKLMVKELSLPLSNTVCIGIEMNDQKDSQKKLEVLDTQFEAIGSVSSWLLSNGVNHITLWHDSESCCNSQVRIENIESLMLIFTQLYSVKPYLGNYIISEIANNSARPNYSHFIYITSFLNDETVSLLAKIHEQVSVSMIFIKDTKSAPDSLILNELSGLNIGVAILNTESVGQDIQEITL